MKSLFKFEIRRLFRGKSFYVCSLIMLAALLLEIILLKDTQSSLPPEYAEDYSLKGIESLLLSPSNAYFAMIAGIFTAVYACDDYEQHTLKNIYARGYTRFSVTATKLISVCVSVSAMFLLVELVGFVLCTALFGLGKMDDARMLLVLAVQYISYIANVIFNFALCSMIRKKGLSITAVILSPILIELFFLVIHSFLGNTGEFYIGDYWLSSFPSAMVRSDVASKQINVSFIGSILYSAVFVYASIYFNKKNEV